MNQSNSSSSNISSATSKSPSPGPFAYQTRLLERTSSRGHGGLNTLSRTNSQSGTLTSSGGAAGSSGISKATSLHRPGNSLDAIRGKWEERSREAGIGDNAHPPTSYAKDNLLRNKTYTPGNPNVSTGYTKPSDQSPVSSSPSKVELHRTPTYLKRHTLPAPIIASPLFPNSTGIQVETGSPSSATNKRIHLPHFSGASLSSIDLTADVSINPSSLAKQNRPPVLTRSDRSNSLATTPISRPYTSAAPKFDAPQSGPSLPSTYTRPHSFSAHSSNLDSKLLNTVANATLPTSKPDGENAAPYSSVTSVMSPPQYRSAYMHNKKYSTNGNGLGVNARRLGRHLPRIASGDGEPNHDEPQSARKDQGVSEIKSFLQGASSGPSVSVRPKQDLSLAVDVRNTEDVAGLPGRIQLKAPNGQSPSPSTRYIGSNWADKQRHLIQAYEYLCHVGEAQQWIEGCLGEELGFGVVEMEEGLRNGVVLAKLVRAFQGDAAVKRIYEAPKLDFRHSQNINVFFNFVRYVGLPEGFIFELTDLYEKKNLPKVIYCIHALSHLLARRGLAERIGNLIGQLHFSDDQLQQTQRGLTESGVSMPNFSHVGRELAKEINEDVEMEIESEDERRERLLSENINTIMAFRAMARGYLVRQHQTDLRSRMRLFHHQTFKLQGHLRGVLTRKRLVAEKTSFEQTLPWVVTLQSTLRTVIAMQRWNTQLRLIQESSIGISKVQAQVRGVLLRRRIMRLKEALKKVKFPIMKLQTAARASFARHSHNEIKKTVHQPQISIRIVGLQSRARGALIRKVAMKEKEILKHCEDTFVALQARCRGVLMRRRWRSQFAKIENIASVVVQIQAAVRTYLARKRLLNLIRGLRRATRNVIGLQASARANVVRQRHVGINKTLNEVKMVTTISNLQTYVRAVLTRVRHREINKQLEVSTPEITGFQAAVRGALLRNDFRAWRDHLHNSYLVATILQAMLRGAALRRSFRVKMEYFRANLSKVVKIQSLFRARETREQYRQLTLGTNVSIGTIKNFVHLLDDSEADFQEEIKIERLRKKVVEHIRENQALENEVNDLDVKIALVVQNVKSFDELMKARKRHGNDGTTSRAATLKLLAAHGDPFSGPNTLDQEARRKLELYQQLFYLLQTRGEYLSRLFTRLSAANSPETNRRFIERVVLTLFGYGQDRREDFLLLKLFQFAIHEEISLAPSIQDIIHEHPLYMNIAVHYVRPKQVTYARDIFQSVILEVLNAEDLDLEANPSVIHRARIDIEEMKSGIPSSQPRDVSFHEALKDPDTRAIYIRHLQVLQWWTEAFVSAITQSTRRLPYGVRLLSREILSAVRNKFPDASDEERAACIGRIVYYRYINPVIIAPETFEIVTKTSNVATGKKNLAQISKILTQITSGTIFSDNDPSYIPINDYVKKAISQMTNWFIEVANVPDAETHFHAHEFLDVTAQPKPIYITPNEIYAIHGILLQNKDYLAVSQNDILKDILFDLGGIPHLDNEELKDARDTPITLELTNRFADVRDSDAEEKTLWVQAKRGVLAILRVQPAQDLFESLMRPVTEDDQLMWQEILEAEENEVQQSRRQPSAVSESGYRLENIRSYEFAEVKATAIANLLKLEKQGKISRSDGFQGILNAIAVDVRSKHRMRLQRQQEMESMNEVLRQLSERKKHFEDQLNSYHSYVETAMNTMQRGKGKKRFVLPFTKQYFHLRDLQRSGETPKFGSYIYTAKEFYERGIILSIDQYSPRQFDKILLTLSSDKAGIFTLQLDSILLGVNSRIASEDIRMEDLLQAKYEKRSSLALFDGKVRVNFELFLYQINKKFYVS